MRIQFSIAGLALVTAVLAFLVSTPPNLPLLVFTLVLECIVIISAVEVIARNLPPRLRESSEDNCVRLDGSWSEHRARVEQSAQRRIRIELLAVFLLVAITGNWLAFFVHYEIIPIPLAAKAVQTFDVDPAVWKENLRDHRIDEEYEQWSVMNVPADHATLRSQQETLWYSWPLVILVGFAWLCGGLMFISSSHHRILREFSAGVALRSESNLDRDISKLQS